MIEIVTGLTEKLTSIQESLPFFIPELFLSAGILLVILSGLVLRTNTQKINYILTFVILLLSFASCILSWSSQTTTTLLFGNMLQSNRYSDYFKFLFDVSGIITLFMSFSEKTIPKHRAEYLTLLLTIILGAHLLVMSSNLVMVFLSLELISLSSYVLTGFSFRKESTEGSLKYFLFGSVSSAIMLYGFSLLYGVTGSLDFTSDLFGKLLAQSEGMLFLLACLLSLSGFLFKVAATPMHPWAPDVYEASPIPVVAFFSVVPKLAGIGILTKFLFAIHPLKSEMFDWQFIMSVIAMATITVGNFSALKQRSPKRMMAYSSIAQSGFLLIGIITFLPEGINFMFFYATVYTIANFLVFIYLQFFEDQSIRTIDEYTGTGKNFVFAQLFLLTGFISLTGLPPTAGFTGKLFIFSSLWEAYSTTDKSYLLWLFIIGLLNTVVSLFYYLRIPFLAFIKQGDHTFQNNYSSKNLFGLILVLLILFLFFQPNMLMGWINKIKFVL